MNKGIELYADGADIQKMYELYVNNIVSGFTTNPTLMRKAGVKDYKLFSQKILELIPDKPISLEVFSDSLNSMMKEAREISRWGENAYVKIPITNTEGVSTTPIIKELSEDGIKLNITAILTLEQVQEVVRVISKTTPSIISVFAGRIADTGINPEYIMRLSSANIIRFHNIKLLWASTRESFNIIQAKNCGCDIITVTPEILNKLTMFGKDLTQLSLETVKMFYEDALKAGYKIC
jgi:transaldolase